MKIKSISLQDFRNIEFARLEFDPDVPTFFVGSNGQGKSNMLEALGMVTAIRSFRTHELSPLIRSNQKLARLLFSLTNDANEASTVELGLSGRKRTVLLDEIPVTRMSDFVGLYPSVVFSADDAQLIKSGPQNRRRFFDLLLSVVDSDYLDGLQTYHRVLKERNQALKQKSGRSVVIAYDRVMAKWGCFLVRKRLDWISRFMPLFEDNYRKIGGEESGKVELKPSMESDEQDAYLKKLEVTFERDQILGSTQSGPHRDDYLFSVGDLPAKTHGSDGQQRSIVLALKLAQIDLIETSLNRKPVIFLDDILGELDNDRKQRFWNIFDHGCQVFASGTSLPKTSDQLNWSVYQVENGSFVSE